MEKKQKRNKSAEMNFTSAHISRVVNTCQLLSWVGKTPQNRLIDLPTFGISDSLNFQVQPESLVLRVNIT